MGFEDWKYHDLLRDRVISPSYSGLSGIPSLIRAQTLEGIWKIEQSLIV